MKSFLKSLGIFVFGIIVGVIAFVAIIVLLVMNFTRYTPGIRDNSYLVLDFYGKIVEKPISSGDFILGSGKSKVQLLKYLRAIKASKFDDKIKGIIINGDFTFYSTVNNLELISAIKDFKKSGKRVYAWFSSGDNSNYLLCSIADKIYMPATNSADLTLTGYSITSPYYKGLFDKVGLDFNVIHMGKFKGTGENYTSNNMTQDLYNYYVTVFDRAYYDKLKIISENRKKDVKDLDGYYKSGKTIMMTPVIAKELGFIDDFKTYEELLDSLRVSGEKYTNTVSITDYMRDLKGVDGGDRIAIVYAEGAITNYYSGDGQFSGDIVGAKTIIDNLREIREDDSIKSVIIRVNSPGGSALASELILKEVLELKKTKKVYISMGDVAASGGYYISSCADKIYSSPLTITGSIGVVSILMNYKKLSEKIGVNFVTINKNKYDDIYNATRKVTDDEVVLMKRSMENIYKEFTDHVVEGRKLKPDVIPNIAEGRIWTGTQAKEIGLVDELATFTEVIDKVKKECGDEGLGYAEFPRPVSFFDKLKYMSDVKAEDFLENKLSESKYLKNIILLHKFYELNGSRPAYMLPYFGAVTDGL